MHPSYHAKAEIAELRKEVAELRARLPAPPQGHDAGLDPRLPAGAPAGAYVGPDGLSRDGRGNLIHTVEPEPYEVRQAAALAEHNAKQRAEHDKAREGLVGGLWRDPSGIVRTQDGQLASNAEIEAQRADAVRQQQGQEQRQHLQRIGLPTRLPVRRQSPDDLAD
jgi:hypothetical protein